MDLISLGWNDFFARQILPEESQLLPARVIRQDLTGYQLESERGELVATLPGKFRHDAQSKAEIPTVGDWVLVSPVADESGKVVIQRLLERKTRFSRRDPGEKLEQQVIAANIDIVFIVSGLDDNFNLNRIERYLLLAWESGAEPCVLLNKADLCGDTEAKISAVKSIANGVRVLAVSTVTRIGLDQLRQLVSTGTTSALLGSSGVGKSTIINSLAGIDHFQTGNVRESDSKGRHTTSHREMIKLSDGGLIIDTPGMREIQVWTDTSMLGQSFSDIEDLAEKCKFRDCQHQSEPQCAVKAAIEAGELNAHRLETYQKLGAEISVLRGQQDARDRLLSKQQDASGKLRAGKKSPGSKKPPRR